MPATVSVLYPAKEGATFNLDYYLSTHMPLVTKSWKSYGLTGYKVTKFGGPDAPYSYGCTLEWDSVEGFQKASQGPEAKEVMGDIDNFSSEKPVIVGGEVVGTN